MLRRLLEHDAARFQGRRSPLPRRLRARSSPSRTDAEREALRAEQHPLLLQPVPRVHPGFADPPCYRTVQDAQGRAPSTFPRSQPGPVPDVDGKDLSSAAVLAGVPGYGAPAHGVAHHEPAGSATSFFRLHSGNQPRHKTRPLDPLCSRARHSKLARLWPEVEGASDGWIPPARGSSGALEETVRRPALNADDAGTRRGARSGAGGGGRPARRWFSCTASPASGGRRFL